MEKITKYCKIIGSNEVFNLLKDELSEDFSFKNLSGTIHEFIFNSINYTFDIKRCIITDKNSILLEGFLSDNINNVGLIILELYN